MQFLAWLGGVVRGELGWSAVAGAPVADVFRQKIAASFELGAAAALGRSAGIGSARSPPDVAIVHQIS